MMKKLMFFSFCFFMVIILSSNGCAKKTPVPTGDNEPINALVYQAGETIQFPSVMEISLQNMSMEPFIPLMDKSVSIQSYPHVYFNQDLLSIIRIQEDGSTINTNIEIADSPNYEVGYIVEKTSEEKHSNAPYIIDVSENKIYPKDPGLAFVMVRLHISNTGNKALLLDELLFFIEAGEATNYSFDHLFAETVLVKLPPDSLKARESAQVEWIAMLPFDTEKCYLVYEDRKIEWKFK